ncbi:hypothetical protein INP83_04240 [Mucilaginibacter sp. 21P]|uniref:hypothetical protein n=1 Tax=Mucilaginibacter sp. 21P TaxID=2778902 RepID=UPI001C569D3D|nr:hypothetical protein [Mucilaginibacter sp. 21P]QXV66303.1 hypothetical protein INP83_04240 [Mucilaginibacter sp. 21P]
MTKATFNRQQLYDLVWAEPLLGLSKKYNISDVGLRKNCLQMGVPLPGAGYWAKMQHGKTTTVTPLPKDHYGQTEVVLYLRDENHPAIVDGMTPQAAMQALIEQEHSAELKISGNLKDADPLIIQAQATLLKRNEYYREGDILKTESGQLYIRVSDPQINRALCIMDAFVKIMRKRGREFKFRNETAYIVIGEEEIEMALRETSTATIREDRWQTRSLNPNGKLEFKFGSYEPTVTGRDGKVLMEDQLAKIIARLELMAEEMRVETIEGNIRRAAYEEKERLRKLVEERQKLEISSFKKSVRDAIRWQETNTFRNYIDHVETKELASAQPDEAILAWVQWARDKADWYDPLIEKEDEWMAGVDRNNILKTEPHKPGGYGFNAFRETAEPNRAAWPLLPWYTKK